MSGLVPHIGWALAFAAGMASFFSPCVAPLMPGYLSLVSGVSIDHLAAGGRTHTLRVLRTSLLFVLGFMTVFVLLGAAAASTGGLVGPNRRLVNQIAGVTMILMGLLVLEVVRLPLFSRERKIYLSGARLGPAGPTLLGMAFAFGWTPCVGPILAAILFYAGTTQTLGQGAWLLLLYGAGMAVPFVATGVVFSQMVGALRWIRHHHGLLTWASGSIMIGMGLLFLTNMYFWVSIALQRLSYTVFYR